MAGIAIVLDLLKKNPSFYSSNSLHSIASFSAKVAISGAAASLAASYPFGFRAFLASNNRVAYCDTAATWTDDHIFKDAEDHIYKDHGTSGYCLEPDSLSHVGKVYHIELKPLFSAFHWKTFGLTTLRSFLMYYLPLLEPHAAVEDDDEDFLDDHPEKKRVDFVAPSQKAIKQIIREYFYFSALTHQFYLMSQSAIVTTRRVLERLVVSYFSQRMAWKLLKDAPKSATRKAERGMPKTIYFYAVTRTTFRAHFLGVAASWIVQVGVDIYKTLSHLFNTKEELDEVDKQKEFELLGRKIISATIRCTASLVFAAIGAGLSASLVRPSLGQWLGCAAGDLAGPVIVAVCFDKLLHVEP
ncbi:hypothetical protein Cgig2_015305 [Carnegiea gigantea]|uniref:Uncharacterized protein n=1 Tax=Carnegiea gigantea TaxID=171969 RepID=A0A9Q1JR49_9CARY|nr:hypothetical protein Cgig2_015305 [Carnegiea gigantea]